VILKRGDKMAIQALQKGVYEDMAYETKVLLIALSKIVKKASNVEEIYDAIADMANAEGILLGPFDEDTDEDKKA